MVFASKILPVSKMVHILLQSFRFLRHCCCNSCNTNRASFKFFDDGRKNLLSISSRPYSSTFNAFNACCVIPRSITAITNTCAKSLTLLNKPLAILGVPRLLPAISVAASEVIFVFKNCCRTQNDFLQGISIIIFQS